jgi:hypothetical protein
MALSKFGQKHFQRTAGKLKSLLVLLLLFQYIRQVHPARRHAEMCLAKNLLSNLQRFFSVVQGLV